MELSRVQPSEIVITSHLGADFDSFGSLIAASCLFKKETAKTEAPMVNPSRPILIWPQSNEDAMNTFIKQREDTLRTQYNFFRSLKEIPEWSNRIKALIVVDTRKITRLKHIQDLLDYFGIGTDKLPSKEYFQVAVVDHHPPSELDIQAHQVIHHLWGSATSIIVKTMIDMKGSLELNGHEATWLILGIYNDTGSFTYASTTEFDFSAASSLRAIPGIDMSFVQTYMHQLFERNNSLQHPALMADEENFKVNLQMQQSAKFHTIYDHSIVISHVILADYIRNFSSAVEAYSEQHQEVLNLVVLARFGGQVVIIGRSKKLSFQDGGIDMGLLCKPFGGGGHFAAASATIKNLTFHQVIDILFAHLFSLCGPKYSVSQLMSTSPVLLSSHQSVADAVQLFQKHTIKTLPVIEANNNKFVGLVDRMATFQCAAHSQDCNSIPITSILGKDSSTLPENATLDEAIELIHRNHQRIVPIVGEGGHVTGVISRSDILAHFLKERNKCSEHPINESIDHNKNIKETLQKKFSAPMLGLLTNIGSIADVHQVRVYITGKALRCALSDLPMPHTVEILTEHIQEALTMASPFIREVTQMMITKYSASVGTQSDHHLVIHCKLKSGNEVDIKMILGTLEQYPYVTPVPIIHVTPLTIHLYRKSFTIDAIAACINQEGGQFGNFFDVFSAAQDVVSKTIEVLDSLAFLESPKRIFKAILLEQSGFVMGTTKIVMIDICQGKNCEKLIKTAVAQVIDNMDGPSLVAAFQMVLSHPQSIAILDRLHYFQILKSIHAGFHVKYVHVQDSLKNVLQAHSLIGQVFPEIACNLDLWKIAFLGLIQPFSDEELLSFMTRLALDSQLAKFFHDTRLKAVHLTAKLKQTEKETKGKKESGQIMIETLVSEMHRQEMNHEGILLAMASKQEATRYFVASLTLYNT